jgi:hypothetical protein
MTFWFGRKRWQVARQARQMYASSLLKTQKLKGKNYDERRAAAVQMFEFLTPEEQDVWMRRVPYKASQATAGAVLTGAKAGEALPPAPGAPDQQPTPEDDEENGKPAKAVGCLLTFNGTWNIDTTIVACILDEFAGQPWRVVGEALRQLPCLASLFAEFWHRMMELCKSRGFANAS